MVGVAVVIATDDGSVTEARVAANGALDHATRLDPVEKALEGESFSEDTIEAAADQATEGIEDWELMDDIQASAEYRGQLLKVYTRRALNSARERV
jgi:carbon-monoxide dehydrogenase medium subunit